MIFRGIFALGLMLFALSCLSEELPLSVTPSIAQPGQTVTVTGTGFQPGVRGLVWGGGSHIVGSVDTPDFAQRVSVVNGYAYVTDSRSSGLQVIDISTPSLPVIVGSVDTPGSCALDTYGGGVSVVNGYAYMAAGCNGLQVIDISTPSLPVIVGSVVDPPGTFFGLFALSVSVANGYAYVTDGGSGLQVIDISTPSAPVIVGSVDTPSSVSGVSVANGYAYVTDLFFGLQVIDISTPSAPVIVGNANTPSFASAVSVANGYAYVANPIDGLQVFDISNPSLPVIVSDWYTLGEALDVSIANGYAYLAGGNNGLWVIDISAPAAPVIVGNVDTPGSVSGVSVANGYAYVADGSSGLLVVSNPVPSVTTWLNSETLTLNVPTHLPPGTYDVTVFNPDGTLYKARNALIIEGVAVPRRLDRFEISAIPDIETNQIFPIEIRALLENGTVDTSFNGWVDLYSNHNALKVDPRKIRLTNGIGSGNVEILGPGATSTILVAAIGSVLGQSNTFSVVDPLAVPTTLSVKVGFDSFFHIGSFSGTVYLENPDGLVSAQATQTDGMYSFIGLSPGVYKLWAVRDSGEWRSPPGHEVEIAASHTPKTQLETLLVNKAGQPPVLMLPGIMGSTINGSPLFKYDDYSYTPILPEARARPSELRILNGSPLNVASDAGFDDLDRELSDAGYNVITVPWDWRASLDVNVSKNAIDEYLKPALAKAKDPDGDGVHDFLKVDVVAHSMGGLLVRAYIQSEGYDYDIRRFAMVGTPNEGSANTYYMVQGGDPQKSDAIGGKCSKYNERLNPYCFYSRATETLYKEMNDGESPFKQVEGYDYTDYSKVVSKKDLIDFYRDDVPTALQLAPTFEVLTKTGNPAPSPLEKDPNQFLIDLNSDADKDRMIGASAICSNPQKVGVKIFASNNVATLDNIQVNPPIEGAALYPDGTPTDTGSVVDGRGDGTVPIESAFGGGLTVDTHEADFGAHAELMRAFKTEIRDFLQQECTP